MLFGAGKPKFPSGLVVRPRRQCIDAGKQLILVDPVRIRIGSRIWGNGWITHSEAVVANVENRCAAGKCPHSLAVFPACPSALGSLVSGLGSRRTKLLTRCARCGGDPGEALPDALARLASWIAAQVVLVFGCRRRQLAASLSGQTQELLGFCAVLVLRIFEDFRQQPNRTVEIVLFQCRPRLIHGGGGAPQVRLRYPARAALLRSVHAGSWDARWRSVRNHGRAN